jgi:uncharacterized membrane protein YbaN (DUF454 family)
MGQLVRVSLVVAGTLCVGLGVLGMFLPVLPTTPFLLLAAICYARGSERFYRWLLTNRWFGEYIRNYREARGIPPRQKLLTLTALWLTILVTAHVAITSWPGRLVLIGIAAGVTVYLLRAKTRSERKTD